jgi:hypothetical protein
MFRNQIQNRKPAADEADLADFESHASSMHCPNDRTILQNPRSGLLTRASRREATRSG